MADDPEDVSLAPGIVLDRYEIVREVARGGMGVVWLAVTRSQLGVERFVAVKTILPALAADARFRSMFLDEVRVASRIEHPHVARVLDAGEDGERLWMALEWVDGESLERLTRTLERRGERAPLGVALRVVADACEGLHAAHEAQDDEGRPLGVVHRDVSPHNILVGKQGGAKLIDFGVFKARERSSSETRAGVVKGKPAYMAPEQRLGKRVDRRADVWSMGAVLHRLLLGAAPFDDEDASPESTAARGPMLPETLDARVRTLLATALAPDPSERFATADAMQRAIEDAMRAAGEHATTADVASFYHRSSAGASTPSAGTPKSRDRSPEPKTQPPQRPVWLVPLAIVVGLPLAALVLRSGGARTRTEAPIVSAPSSVATPVESTTKLEPAPPPPSVAPPAISEEAVATASAAPSHAPSVALTHGTDAYCGKAPVIIVGNAVDDQGRIGVHEPGDVDSKCKTSDLRPRRKPPSFHAGERVTVTRHGGYRATVMTDTDGREESRVQPDASDPRSPKRADPKNLAGGPVFMPEIVGAHEMRAGW